MKRNILRELSGIPKLKPARQRAPPLTHLTKLANGVRVASQETYGQCTTVGALVRAGSRFESKENRGAAQFLEQTAFNTQQHFAAMATCGREDIFYTVDCMREDAGRAMEALSVPINHYRQREQITNESLQESRHILNFINEDIARETPAALVTEHAVSRAFGNGQPLSQGTITTTGTTTTSTNAESVMRFHADHFHGDNIVVAAAGLSHDEAVQLAETHFGHIPPLLLLQRILLWQVRMWQSTRGGCSLSARTCTLDSSTSPWAFTSAAGTTTISFPHASCTACLEEDSFSAGGPGKGMFTRLYQQVLNRYHWVESVQGFTSIFDDAGVLGMTGSTKPTNMTHLFAAMCAQMRVLATKPAPDIELHRARNMLKSGVLMALESRGVLCEDIARQILTYGNRESAESVCAKIDSVTAADLQRVAQQALASVPTVIVYGDISTTQGIYTIKSSIR